MVGLGPGGWGLESYLERWEAAISGRLQGQAWQELLSGAGGWVEVVYIVIYDAIIIYG